MQNESEPVLMSAARRRQEELDPALQNAKKAIAVVINAPRANGHAMPYTFSCEMLGRGRASEMAPANVFGALQTWLADAGYALTRTTWETHKNGYGDDSYSETTHGLIVDYKK